MALYQFDQQYRLAGIDMIAGVDEAGRGPWAGPVVAAAVILPAGVVIAGVNDSKKLTPKKRDTVYDAVMRSAIAVGVEVVAAEIIDTDNILQATFRAMRGALARLSVAPQLVLVDGCWKIPALTLPQKAIVSGDAKSASIAAASIIAKVTRDRMMAVYASEYPRYQFEKHKGYGTKDHYDALCAHGPCPLHRKSFEPVRRVIEERAGK